MEEVEVTFVVGAIGWLVQTILESLLSGKLEAWIRHVGLADDIEKLRSEIERVEMAVAAVKGRAIGNKPLARSLARLKELLYDADDAVDDLDYYRLQQQVQGVAWHDTDGTDGHGAGQVERPRGNADIPSSSRGKKRSKAWGDFEITEEENGKPVKAKCIHCHTVVKCGSDKGTSVLHNHLRSDGCKKKRGASDQQPNTSSTCDGTTNGTPVAIGNSFSRKRMRMDNESNHVTATNTHTWNKAEFSNRIQEITRQLQDIRGDASEVLKLHGLDSVASSNHHRSTNSDPSLRTSSLAQRKVYGRVAEKNSIIEIDGPNLAATPNLSQSTHPDTAYLVEPKVYGRDKEMEYILNVMAHNKSDDIIVLPIVGIGGVGKTTLARLVCQTIGSQFDIKIWICVSDNADVNRLTREMLDCVSKGRQERTSNFDKHQQDIEKHMKSKRFLIVLDDVWGDMSEHHWDKLLAPLRTNQVKGNIIVVTTRILSVAEVTGTVDSVKLGTLETDDFWLLFKSCAFGEEKYEEHPSLRTIGKKIARGLSGNPLAAKTVGALLRRNISIDHWSNVLNNEEWKSLQHSGGIMPALKLSYDYLPDHLQQCFRYCCLFPKDCHFDVSELVGIWISQGFVYGNRKKLEDTGKDYLSDLVNSGFFQQVKKEWNSLEYIVMHDLMHDLTWEISRAEFATIDGSECKEILPSVRHLSIVNDSACCEKDRHGNAFPCENFEKKLLQVTSMRKLRSLVLVGQYDSRFFKYLQNMLKESQNLRLLQISATCADFDCLIRNLVNCTHIRYIKVHLNDNGCGVLPQALSNYFHLQVLHVGLDAGPTLPSGVNNLVSLRHLIARQEVLAAIANIGNMTVLQELHKFKVQNASGFDIRQLQSMNQLVLLGIYQLQNVRSEQEAREARLTDKWHLEDLHLSWDEDLHLSWDGSTTSSGASTDTAIEVLEGLKPHENLKHLEITGYNGWISPSWLATDLSVTSLRSLHLEKCEEWLEIPPLDKLPLLMKLKLINMCAVEELSIPCLEELVLTELPSLKRCVGTSRELTSHLRVLMIEKCPELKDFTLLQFQNFCSSAVEQNSGMSNQGSSSKSGEFASAEAERKEWPSSLRELKIRDCPRLIIALHPLPPSPDTKVHIEGVSRHPTIKTFVTTLDIEDGLSVKSSDVRFLDDKILAFQNLRVITSLHIEDFPNLESLPFEGFRQLTELSELKIVKCGKLLSSYIMPDAISEEREAANSVALPSLTRLEIRSCGIAGKWLTQMLPHMGFLEELRLQDCPQIKYISIYRPRQEGESSSLDSSAQCRDVVPACLAHDEILLQIPSNVLSTIEEFCISDCPDVVPACLAHEEFILQIPSNVLLTLKIFSISDCPGLEFCGSKDGFGGFTTLVELSILSCPKLLSSADERFSLPSSLRELSIQHLPAKLQPYFPDNQTFLKKLGVGESPNLKSLRLESCTALEELNIQGCQQLAVLEGLQYHGSLESLAIEMNPELSAKWYRKYEERDKGSDHARLLPPSVEVLEIYNLRDEILPCFLAQLPSLERLEVFKSPDLTSLQLDSCTALTQLGIKDCESLNSLNSLQSLGNITNMKVRGCPRVQIGGYELCYRLETLQIDDPSVLTTSFCELLTSLHTLEIFGGKLPGQLTVEELVRHLLTDEQEEARQLLTDEQEEALQLLTSLQNLYFYCFRDPIDLPAGLHSLPSLKKLVMYICWGISRLPEKGLPPTLEKLKIADCSEELNAHCMMLATSKLKVKIDLKYVN